MQTPEPQLGTVARPSFSYEDGSPIGGTLGIVHHAIAHSPLRFQPSLQRAARRMLSSRLPALRAKYADGRVFTFGARDPMYSTVFVFGEYEPAESAVVRGVLRDGDLAIDVGANIGWFSLLMASCVGVRGSVLAIEPTPPIRRHLLENISANPDLDIQVLSVALGARADVAEIHLFEGLPHGHASLSALGRNDDVTFQIRIERLDDLIEPGSQPPAFIKLDVEGSELDVLRGAQGLLSSQAPPMWLVEVNHETSAKCGYSPSDLLDTLRDYADYRAFRLSDGHLSPEVCPSTAPHSSTWLCVPPTYHERLSGLS